MPTGPNAANGAFPLTVPAIIVGLGSTGGSVVNVFAYDTTAVVKTNLYTTFQAYTGTVGSSTYDATGSYKVAAVNVLGINVAGDGTTSIIVGQGLNGRSQTLNVFRFGPTAVQKAGIRPVRPRSRGRLPRSTRRTS